MNFNQQRIRSLAGSSTSIIGSHGGSLRNLFDDETFGTSQRTHELIQRAGPLLPPGLLTSKLEGLQHDAISSSEPDLGAAVQNMEIERTKLAISSLTQKQGNTGSKTGKKTPERSSTSGKESGQESHESESNSDEEEETEQTPTAGKLGKIKGKMVKISEPVIVFPDELSRQQWMILHGKEGMKLPRAFTSEMVVSGFGLPLSCLELDKPAVLTEHLLETTSQTIEAKLDPIVKDITKMNNRLAGMGNLQVSMQKLANYITTKEYEHKEMKTMLTVLLDYLVVTDKPLPRSIQKMPNTEKMIDCLINIPYDKVLREMRLTTSEYDRMSIFWKAVEASRVDLTAKSTTK